MQFKMPGFLIGSIAILGGGRPVPLEMAGFYWYNSPNIGPYSDDSHAPVPSLVIGKEPNG